MTMDDVTFDVETQTAAAITNIGGDQTVYTGERTSPVPRLFSIIGLALTLGGLGLLVMTGIGTADTLLAENSWPLEVAYYTENVAATWLPAVILLAGGIVLSRVGRALRRG
jgi:hypothetical protein